MRVRFRETGGFAGLTKGCDIDTSNVPDAVGADLRALVAQGRAHMVESKTDRRARDTFAYQVVIEDGDERFEVTFDDVTLPKDVMPLIRFLQKRSEPLPL